MPPKKADTDPAKTKATADQQAGEPKAETPEYTQHASKLADDTRGLVEEIRDKLAGLTKQFNELQQTAPTAAEGTVTDGARRIPMSVSEVERALEGLHAVAADLQQRSAT